MAYCARCGSSCKEGDRFCRQCGNTLFPSGQEPSAINIQNDVPPTLNRETPVYETFENNTKKRKKGVFALIAALVGVAAACLFIFTNVFGNHTYAVSKMTTYYEGSLLRVQNKTYDNKGNLLSRTNTTYDEDGNIVVQYVSEYSYANGHEMISAMSYNKDTDGSIWNKEEYRVQTEKRNNEWYYHFLNIHSDNLIKTEVYSKNCTYLRTLDEYGNVQTAEELEYDTKGRIVSVRDTGYFEDGSIDWYEIYDINYKNGTAEMRCIDSSNYEDIGMTDLVLYLEFEHTMFW